MEPRNVMRDELLKWFNERDLKPVEPRAKYQPPFEGPVIGFGGQYKAPTPRGGEDDFVPSYDRVHDDCGDNPLDYWTGHGDGVDLERRLHKDEVVWAGLLGLLAGFVMTAMFVRAW